MQQFIIPQFVEREARIVGPMTFKQFLYVFVAGVICIFLYFAVPTGLFVIGSIFLIGIAGALAFLKIGQIPLPVFIKNMFFFLFKPKVYLWRKKVIPQKITVVVERSKKPEEEKLKPSLKIRQEGRLSEIHTHLQTK